MRRRDFLATGTAAAILPNPSSAQSAHARSFKPGEVRLDTAGKPIFVRGSSILQIGDTFYWYGENKERTTGKDKIWHWGMRCYKSKDLYDWEDLGLIIPPVLDDPQSPLHPHQLADRPHILFNKETKKFVCWIKYLHEPFQTRSVLVADAITGPWRLIRKHMRPLGMGAGDFDLVTSPDDGKAYMYFERVHCEMICADLTDDYTDLTGYYTTHLPRSGPPETREGLAYFRRGTRHYLVGSGTTGYFPNPTEIAIADTYHGPWKSLGLLHKGDNSETSFNSQISAVFKHPGKKDLYIAIADRWMGPMSGKEFESGELSRLVRRSFAKSFAHPPLPMTVEEKRVREELGGLGVNTSQARPVWLPISFDGERPYIKWRDEWSLDEFA